MRIDRVVFTIEHSANPLIYLYELRRNDALFRDVFTNY